MEEKLTIARCNRPKLLLNQRSEYLILDDIGKFGYQVDTRIERIV